MRESDSSTFLQKAAIYCQAAKTVHRCAKNFFGWGFFYSNPGPKCRFM